MRVRINQKELVEAMSGFLSITERKTTMRILSTVLIEAKKDQLVLTATDLEIGSTLTLQAQVFEEGALAVPARDMAEIAREAGEAIDLETLENHWLYIQSGKSQFRLACLDPKEFPSLPLRESEVYVETEAHVLSDLMSKVSFAMSKDETRYNLNSVFLDGFNEGLIRFVATDGHRLASVEAHLPFPETYHALLPRKGVTEFIRFSERLNASEKVRVYLGKKNLDVVAPSMRLIVRLVDGEFPKYEQIIPKETDKSIRVRRDLLLGALRRVCIVANERSYGVRLSVSPGMIELSAQNTDKSEGKEELDCDYRGEFFHVGFNARYFIDILNTMDGDVVTMSMKAPLAPCLFTSEDDPGFQAILMPMRI